jgi:mannose-6-phosphate isomerase-like protein (cupin superfamily)
MTHDWGERLAAFTRGHVASDEVEAWVESAWSEGRFVAAVSEEALARLPRTGRRVPRYGTSHVLRSEVCLEHPNGTGAVVVHTPAMPAWDEAARAYCVAPHAHGSAHVTVVLSGHAHFFIARKEGAGARIVRIAASPGDVLVCPPGVAHTFGSNGEAFTVLSIQSRFVEPSEARFARDVALFDDRRVVGDDANAL